ncbi:MAG: hypothetical protein OWT27_01070 [Firmicutes bacterium]|nr:hypothetical protein [Bacillota bacterium]
MPDTHRPMHVQRRKIASAGARKVNGGPRTDPKRPLGTSDVLARLRQLECEVCCLEDKVDEALRRLQHQILAVSQQVSRLSAEVASGQPANPGLQTLFNSSSGTTVTVTVASGTLTGTVTAVGTNAVLLTESDGDILIIPYSKITGIE